MNFTRLLYVEFGWVVFYIVGANRQAKSTLSIILPAETLAHTLLGIFLAMYQFYQVLNVLLIFDLFTFVGTTMQVCHPFAAMVWTKLTHVTLLQLVILVLTNTGGAEYPLTIIAIPVVLILIIGCIVAAKYEIKWLMTISLILM